MHIMKAFLIPFIKSLCTSIFACRYMYHMHAVPSEARKKVLDLLEPE